MEPDRLARIVGALADEDHRTDGVGAGLDRLLRTATDLVGVTCASVAIMDGGEHQGTVAASDATSAAIDELQFSLGEGPCLDADRTLGPVLESDLAAATGTWPAFAPAALDLSCRAAFAFPLRVGAARVGVLGLYREAPGELGDRDLGDAVAIADVATHVLLAMEAGLEVGVLPDRLDDVLQHRRIVHQATGMVVAQLDVDAATALARLRGWAWARDRHIDDVAADVVDGRLRFPRDP